MPAFFAILLHLWTMGLAVLCLCSCTQFTNWLDQREFEESTASKSARPVGVSYDVCSSTEPRKQVSMFFNGNSLARVLEPGDNWTEKTLLNYENYLLTKKDFRTEMQDISKIDPLQFPPILNAEMAKREKAVCIGAGRSKGYAYHRWSGKNNKGEWEVWTDDNDNFPIYYRAIKHGEVCTWTMVNSWIDGSTYNNPTFFTTEADPPPPEPEKTEEQKEKEEQEAMEKAHLKRHHQIAKKSHKRSE